MNRLRNTLLSVSSFGYCANIVQPQCNAIHNVILAKQEIVQLIWKILGLLARVVLAPLRWDIDGLAGRRRALRCRESSERRVHLHWAASGVGVGRVVWKENKPSVRYHTLCGGQAPASDFQPESPHRGRSPTLPRHVSRMPAPVVSCKEDPRKARDNVRGGDPPGSGKGPGQATAGMTHVWRVSDAWQASWDVNYYITWKREQLSKIPERSQL